MHASSVIVRSCHRIDEFEAMVDLEVEVWGFGQRDVVPSQMYVVAVKTGGQVIGAFLEEKLIGFALAYPGIRDGQPYLHSHMAAVLPQFRDLGIGRSLKLAQRDDALARGIDLIEWTFDPLQTRNAYFNICRLGIVCRRYLLDVYGSTSSPLHAGLPTDRLVAEWHLKSDRVVRILAGDGYGPGNQMECVEVLLRESSPDNAAAVQSAASEQFQDLFVKGYEVTWFERKPGGGSYVLEPLSARGA